MAPILHHRRPCCGRPARLPAVPGTVRRCCRTCSVTWLVRIDAASDHTRRILGHDVYVARWERVR